MKLASYLKYAPSGVEWLGDVPAHWEVRRLRHTVNMRVSNVDKHIKDGELPVRLCNYVDVYKNDRITESVPFMKATANADEIDRFRLEPEDILITKDSEVWNDIGVPTLVEYSAKDLVCGYHLALLRSRKAVLNGAYLFRALQSPALAYQFHIAANGVTRYGLSHHAIKSALLPIPPLPEQAAIVRYLDHADGRIRRSISAKERLIELLEEQRQAVIHRAVTRGLDPDVRLKPSGVEWLGDVPAHWDVRRLKDWVGINKAVLPETTHPSFEFRYLEIGAVGTGVLIDEPSTIRFSDAPSRARRIVRSGDTIVSTVRTYLKAVWFAEDVHDDLICSTGFAVLTPRQETAPKFVSYLAQSNAFTDRVTAESVGIAYPAIAESRLSSFHVSLPPLAEQAAIVEYLDKATADIDAAIARARRHVELLHEYRTHLIADVVTGKLDVREAVATLSENTDESNRLGETDECSELERAHDHAD